MTSLTTILSDIVGGAFEALELPAELGSVRVSDRPDLAQFQCNGAMAAAKVARKAPRAVAEEVVKILSCHPEQREGSLDSSALPQNDIFRKIEIAGPGFINLNVSDDFLAAHLSAVTADERCGTPQLGEGAVVLDYGGPNVAKAMHVGHLRASIIGDSLNRLMKFAGFDALGDVHLGDWGTQMGMVISELKIRQPDLVYFDESFAGPYPEEPVVTLAELEEIYPAASKACKEDEERAAVARLATKEMQDGRPGYRALWQHFMTVSVEGMKKNFSALGVEFDVWKGESSVHDLIAPMVVELEASGHAIKDQGAIVVPVKKNDDNKEVPPLILLKSDGAAMYGTSDLATIKDRMAEYSPHKIIYVVDQRQSLHFEQVFRAARLAGYAPEDKVELTFAGFGTMNGTDGKPFKTRAGGVLKLEDLIGMGLEKARARLAEANLAADMSAEEKEDIAHKVAVAAIKFADLQNQRQSDYIFDIDRMTAFEGKTGPYMLYQAVRIKSLLRKAAEQGDQPGAAFALQETDRPLALLLTELPDVIDTALRHYAPHYLCDYAYRLAQAFSSFYNSCHILSEEDAGLKASRLALCALTVKELELVLSLLGIRVPERM
ncbi:MAG: arginine--tRNA ligase [Rhodospirillales bacterium]|nr:arginine--tRNA ligase [Rhodospirillales bacterium]